MRLSKLDLAREIGLPGEAWPILGELAHAQAAYRDAATLIRQLAQTISLSNHAALVE